MGEEPVKSYHVGREPGESIEQEAARYLALEVADAGRSWGRLLKLSQRVVDHGRHLARIAAGLDEPLRAHLVRAATLRSVAYEQELRECSNQGRMQWLRRRSAARLLIDLPITRDMLAATAPDQQ